MVFAALLLLMFGDVLTSQHKLLSASNTDLAGYFSYVRWAGFSQIKSGTIPLWNPSLFSGMPFQANFQAAFFYPINWIHLILPPVLALNWEIVLNVFLAGLGMYFWASQNGKSFTASVLAGVLLMFGMPYFLRIHGGHLAPLGAMAWIPWIFAAVDALFNRVTLRTLLRGVAFCALQLLAGHPQTAFTTAIAVGLYATARLVALYRANTSADAKNSAVHFTKIIFGVGAFALGGIMLASVQIVPSMAAASETVRSRVTYEFATFFSFPPENIWTAIVPGFFGDSIHADYWGRWYLWEMSLFFGIGGLVLAICGLHEQKTQRWTWIVPLGLLFLLALGGHTPLLRLLHATVPGFDRFRSHSKFTIPLAVMLIFLAASGFDALESRVLSGDTQYFRRLGRLLGGVALILGITALVVLNIPSFWQGFLTNIGRTEESYIPIASYSNDAFVAATSRWTAQSLAFAVLTTVALAALLWQLPKRSCLLPFLAFLVAGEVFAQATFVRPTFDVAQWYPKDKAEFAKEHPEDDRILDTTGSNAWMILGKGSAWGYDPFVLRRYIEVLAATQDAPLNDANYYLQIRKYHPLMQMLRCRYVAAAQNGALNFGELPPALPHVLMLKNYRVLEGRDQVLTALLDKEFDPRREVILEQKPEFVSGTKTDADKIRLISQTSDSLDIEATVSSPQILLVTDSYSKGWRAESLEGSSQQSYELLPANWTLRAVPLNAGKHRLRIVYDPPSFHIGKTISLFALLLYMGAWGWLLRDERRHGTRPSTVEIDRTL